ncbi:hypothetical protein FJ251_05520 [bacterium]|nr:hypothetical protein [bacterium]
MGLASGERRRDNHIRSISWLFLGESRPAAPLFEAASATCRLWGEPGSPWPLALAANLGLAAWRRGESACLELPAARLAVVARLLGAPPAALGLGWRGEGPLPRLEPLPGLWLTGSGGGAAPPDCRWRFALDEERLPLPAASPILALLETADSPLPLAAGAPLFLLGLECTPLPAASPILALLETADSPLPLAAGAPLFLLGLECTPLPRPGVTGIWGPLARHQLLDPGRGGEAALRAGEGSVRRRYGGFLEALRSLPAPGRGEGYW